MMKTKSLIVACASLAVLLSAVLSPASATTMMHKKMMMHKGMTMHKKMPMHKKMMRSM